MQQHRNRTYGRRKGKALRPRQKLALQDLLPKLAIDCKNLAEQVTGLFEPPVEDVWLEIGFGGGEHLVDLAGVKPGIGFVGCEPFINGVVKAVMAADAHGLNNIRIHPGDALDLIACLPDTSIGRAYLLYPDPWPKARQKKRRFVTEDSLEALARVLKPGGQLRFASDIEDYCDWTLERVEKSKHFSVHPRDAFTPWADWKSTRYEDKARREGRTSR
ncbi:MAG: tRNA (guanosine(46)-N7)-methyltransferase TrmB, partial [Hyphomicrobiales bacterium]|nr:tRNA (guanosine(46)-N7)-methyltransferase TrmB [Hyphomicrobiales bacterium]